MRKEPASKAWTSIQMSESCSSSAPAALAGYPRQQLPGHSVCCGSFAGSLAVTTGIAARGSAALLGWPGLCRDVINLR